MVPCQSHEFRSGVFEIVPAFEYGAVTAFAELGETPGVDVNRLRVAAVQEHKQNMQTRRLLQGSVVKFGARLQVCVWLRVLLFTFCITSDVSQFLHVKSGKWLTARPRKVATARKDGIAVELDELGDAPSPFVILPRYKHRQYGKPVRYVAAAVR